MERMRGAGERGFTLIEVVVAVGIIATTAAAGVGISLASRSFGVAAAATEFDHLLDSARTISRQVQGATIAFVPDAYGDGTEVRVYAGTTNGTPVATTLPPLYTHAMIEEVESLGKPPFAFVLHVNGTLGGRAGYRIGANSATAEIGCPAKGAFHFLIHVNGGSADRFIPCRTPLAATGPATLTIWPAATIAPLPTPCAASCTPAALPTAPSSSPSCPPNFTAIPGGCTPTPARNAGARYHVSVAVASPTISIGGTDSFTAQATLTNPGSVPVGTPASVPVTVQQSTSTVCTVSPQGSQASGTTFTLNGISAGTCTIVVQADVSAINGATADSATVSVPVSSSPAPTPTPASCDLFANGKCYHRIVDKTLQTFSKNVIPATQCGQTDSGPLCWYLDSIQSIVLGAGYSFVPPTLPNSASTELLFQIDQLDGATYGCTQFSNFEATPANMPILWTSVSTGAPNNPPDGFGEPSIFATVNHIIPDTAGSDSLDDTTIPWNSSVTLERMTLAMNLSMISSPYRFTYSSQNISAGQTVTWFPDFAGCDSTGDIPSKQYGLVSVQIAFEVFQAQ